MPGTGRCGQARIGMSLVEVLVSLSVVGMLLALVIPAVQQSRSVACRVDCANRLRQVGLAAQNYESTHRYFPGATDPLKQLWPYLDVPETTDLLQLESVVIPGFVCPADGTSDRYQGRYPSYFLNGGTGVQSQGWDGFIKSTRLPSQRGPSMVVELFGWVRAAEVTDGLSNTAAFSERTVSSVHHDGSTTGDSILARRASVAFVIPELWQVDQLDEFADRCQNHPIWDTSSATNFNTDARGKQWYNHVLPPNRNSCLNGGPYDYRSFLHGAVTVNSYHEGVVNCVFGDGSLRQISESIDRVAWRASGSRDGGESNGAF